MKVNVCCVYWTLLFVSFLSSCLLFILVATESGVTDSSDKTQNVSGTLDDLLTEVSEVLKERAELILEEIVNFNEKNSNEDKGQHQQKHENLAEIHSSFEEVVSSSNGDNMESNEAAVYSVPPEPLSDVSAGYVLVYLFYVQ